MNQTPAPHSTASACPRFCLVTPSFNQAAFLERALESVLDQAGVEVELIVMDGGSTDGSAAVIRRHAGRLAYWQSQPDGGQAAAINAGFAKGGGQILGWLNADDILLPGALATVARHFATHPACQWAAGTCQIVGARARVLDTIVPNRLTFAALADWYQNMIYQPAVFWRRELWEQVGGLDEQLRCAMDVDLWLRFARETPGLRIDAVLAQALRHSRMKSRVLEAESFVETALVLTRHGEFDQARKMLSRVVKRAFEVDRALSIVTRHPLYRRWRENREAHDATRPSASARSAD